MNYSCPIINTQLSKMNILIRQNYEVCKRFKTYQKRIITVIANSRLQSFFIIIISTAKN